MLRPDRMAQIAKSYLGRLLFWILMSTSRGIRHWPSGLFSALIRPLLQALRTVHSLSFASSETSLTVYSCFSGDAACEAFNPFSIRAKVDSKAVSRSALRSPAADSLGPGNDPSLQRQAGPAPTGIEVLAALPLLPNRSAGEGK